MSGFKKIITFFLFLSFKFKSNISFNQSNVYPDLAKLVQNLMTEALSRFSFLVYSFGNGDIPSTKGAPKTYGNSSPKTPLDHSGKLLLSELVEYPKE